MNANEPRFGEFELCEYRRRIDNVRKLMARGGLDALLLTTAKHLRYFAGGPLTALFEDTHNVFFLLLPLDPAIDATLLMSSGREGACRTSWVPDQRFWGYDEEDASLMNQRKSLEFVATVIKEKGFAAARIGTELDAGQRLGMTIAEYTEFRELLPGVSWQSCAAVVCPVMEVKSAPELDKLRAAARITNNAFKLALESARPGMTEKELASIIYQSYFEQGATDKGFLAVFAGRERGIWADALPSDNVMRPGDLLMLDGGCQVDGYIADISRMGSFGEPAARDRRLYDLARQANAAAVEMVRPGVEMRELFAAGQRPYIDAGVADLIVFGTGQLGHGIGLSLHDDPDIAADSHKPLKAGMAIAVEPAISDKPRWRDSEQFFIVENNLIVTEHGHEMLTTLSDELALLA